MASRIVDNHKIVVEYKTNKYFDAYFLQITEYLIYIYKMKGMITLLCQATQFIVMGIKEEMVILKSIP